MSIQFEQVSFGYGERNILTDFTLHIGEERPVCLFGPSGCGKTTVLRLAAGLEQPRNGRILGTQGKRVAVVFQENRLLPWANVQDNIALADRHGDGCAVLEQAAAVGLSDCLLQRPSDLSGGMRRRVAIARALVQNGDVLLLDEPFNGLDEPLWLRLAAHLRACYARKPILLVTHDRRQAEALGAQIIPMG